MRVLGQLVRGFAPDEAGGSANTSRIQSSLEGRPKPARSPEGTTDSERVMVLSSLRDSGVLQWPLPGDESPGYFLTPLQGYGLSR